MKELCNTSVEVQLMKSALKVCEGNKRVAVGKAVEKGKIGVVVKYGACWCSERSLELGSKNRKRKVGK